MLEQYHLGFELKNGRVAVTSLRRLQGDLAVRQFPVSDLIDHADSDRKPARQLSGITRSDRELDRT